MLHAVIQHCAQHRIHWEGIFRDLCAGGGRYSRKVRILFRCFIPVYSGYSGFFSRYSGPHCLLGNQREHHIFWLGATCQQYLQYSWCRDHFPPSRIIMWHIYTFASHMGVLYKKFKSGSGLGMFSKKNHNKKAANIQFKISKKSRWLQRKAPNKNQKPHPRAFYSGYSGLFRIFRFSVFRFIPEYSGLEYPPPAKALDKTWPAVWYFGR